MRNGPWPPLSGAAANDPVPVSSDVTALVMEHLLVVLEHRPDLAARLSALVHPASLGGAAKPPQYMTIKEYAAHARVSAKTVLRYLHTGMVAGTHYTLEGASKRRVVICVSAADAWRAHRSAEPREDATLHEIAMHDVARRRAVSALRKHGSR